MRKMKLFFAALAVMMTTAAFGQQVTVTGNVYDATTDESVPPELDSPALELEAALESDDSVDLDSPIAASEPVTDGPDDV